jgi:hypothetical protein
VKLPVAIRNEQVAVGSKCDVRRSSERKLGVGHLTDVDVKELLALRSELVDV